METIYWTKPIFKWDENENMFIKTGEFEDIKECKEGYVPDGDGFAVDMNGIKYKTYLKNPEKYKLESNILIEIKEEEEK